MLLRIYRGYISSYLFLTAPTVARDLEAVASSRESIYISWNHPQYPNSKLTQYIIYHRVNPSMIQMSSISSDGPIEIEIIARTNTSGKTIYN